ncbi:unnamed protein product [Meganyctiphanes norvegica]|uniref:Mitochondrial 2-oxoglutarate/malate carrier protein n=1 Tax=Meganyctiphanes norvegica TaxID=48144 RepID=A0AAV2QA80_MEGNR
MLSLDRTEAAETIIKTPAKVKNPAEMASAADVQKAMPNGLKFIFGGLSGMGAVVFTQPLDLVKNRMQASKAKSSSMLVISGIIKNEGMTKLYTGFSAGLARQATYTTTRIGVYTLLFEHASKLNHGEPPNFFYKLAFGMAAGVCGAFVGNPTEISLIRMTSDGLLPKVQRRNYTHVFNAVFRITKEEGVNTLWRGTTTTMGRAMVVNAAQLATYSQAKQGLFSTGYFDDNIFLHFCASMISGFVTSAASMPLDMAKTRIQNMKIIDGKPEYKGAFEVISKVVRKEGFFSLWKGFMPYYMRIGPNTVLTFVLLEQLTQLYKKHILGDTQIRGGI